MPEPLSHRLRRHPWSRGDAVREITAAVRRTAAGALAVRFHLAGDLTRIRLPPARPAAIAAGLWRHTCFEVFVRRDDAAPYHEFNLSPSGEWAVLAFRAYRDGALLGAARLAPAIVVRRDDAALALDAHLALDRLSSGFAAAALRLGLSAVVEGIDGSRAYWALNHPAGRPDFHHACAFALPLERPEAEC